MVQYTASKTTFYKHKLELNMINIGIEKHQGLVYEGDSNYGRGVWPTPVITPAKFVYPSEGDLKAAPASDVFGYRFREIRMTQFREYGADDFIVQKVRSLNSGE